MNARESEQERDAKVLVRSVMVRRLGRQLRVDKL
jgi:hypothetical protein